MFKNFAYAKLNLDFDSELFAKEYDEKILPEGIKITNSHRAVKLTEELNKIWNMVDPELYDTADYYEQPGDATTMKYVRRDRPQWLMVQLMQLDTTGIDDPLLLKWAYNGGQSLRNESLDKNFFIKPQFKDLQIYKWILDNLPFEKINSIHCVSLEPGGMSTIHRDMKGLYDGKTSAHINRVSNNGFVNICLNISNGGSPLYWALDGKDLINVIKTDDKVYLTNDYFMHGVGITTSRRRQVRVVGRPKPEMMELFDKNTIMDLGDDYEYDPSWEIKK